MDTEKRQSLVKRHEQIDVRVWNQFFGAWWPLAPWSELSVTYRADLGVDQGTVTVPYSHPCASIFRQVRDGVPAPISIEINGVFISGQITTAQAERAEETQAWHLTVQTDAKHAHSMMARPLVQSAADSAETQLRGELGVVARQLIGLASSRTGLPAYVCVDSPGDPVDLVARTEDTVADVLSHAVSGSDLFVDVRMLLPGQDLPGENIIERFAGSVERQWENAALDAGLWPHAEHHERLIDVAEGPNGVVPPFSWRGVASVNHLGELLDEPAEGYVWLPFATQAPYIGSEYYEPDRPMLDGSRVITAAALDSHAEKFPGWASFVTEWKSGAVFSELQENERLHEAAKVGLLKLPDGTKLPASWAELGPLLHDYLAWDDRNFTTPGVFAWRDGASWVISNATDIVEEKAKRAANLAQKQTPGVLFHFYPERDRRGIIFSSVPGGGLKEWSATYTAPDAAMLIAAAQLDEWTMNQMGLGSLPEQAVTGEQSATPVDASTMKNIPATVEQIDVDVQPQARLEGSDVAYHAAGGRVDIGKAGPFFYREKYLNLGNSGTINPVQQMSQEWSRAQGSTTVQLTPSGRGGAVFGDDIVGDDGRRIPGWKHGDRVSFVDGDTRISEVIVGWTLEAHAGETLEISPILGREDNGILAQLGERIRGAERTSKKTALSPPRRIPAKEIEDRAEDVFVREESAWSERIRASVDAANRASAESHVHSKRSSVFSAQSVVHSQQARQHSDKSAEHSDASWEFSQNSLDYSRDSFTHAEEAGEWSDLSWEHSQASAGFSDASRIASEASSEASRQAGLHSGQAWDHSEAARGYSEAAQGHSADANAASLAAGGYSTAAQSAASEAAGHSEDAAGHSETAAGHSTTAKDHSDAASGHSTAASEASTTAGGHSQASLEYSDAANTASLAAAGSAEDAEEYRRLAENARGLAEEARDLAEDARSAAETERSLAEDARSAAEEGRADAEAARDRAEQARARSMASMSAAEMMRAMAEEARRLAEVARELAEGARADAEDERRDAELARDAAEGFRDDAETKRSNAEGERKAAELARGEAEQARKRAMAAMAGAEMMRMGAEQSRALAEQERKKAELERADAEDEREKAETARDEAEDARDTAEGHRSTAFTHMQDAFISNEGASKAAVDAALSAQASAEKALEAQLVGWRKFIHPGPHGLTLDDDRVGVTIMPNGLSGEIYAKPSPSWAGEFFGKVYYENNTVQTIYSKVPHVASLVFGGGNTPVTAVEVDYRDSQRRGKNSREVLSTGWQVPENNTWYQYRDGQPWSVTVQHPTDFTAVFAVGWDAAGYSGSYSIQARVNDVPVRTVKNTGFGPQFFWQGGGFRTQLLDLTGADALSLNAGDTVSFWVIRERNGNTTASQERKIREFSLRVTWSEPV